MGLYRVAVLLMCACVVTSDVIDNDEYCEYTIEPADQYTDVIVDWTPPDTADDDTVDIAETEEVKCTEPVDEFAEFIADWRNGNNTANSPQHATDRQLEDRLYESVYYSNYDKAVQQCKDIVKQGRSHVIKSTVDFLIQHKKSQTTAFAYKLWEAKGGVVVEKLFPDEFEMVFNDSLVIFTNYWYTRSIELSGNEDVREDKKVLANNRSPWGETFTWKLEPVNMDGDIYFKIRHNVDGRYLKLAATRDRDGDYLAYGSLESDTKRHLWSFQPVKHEGEMLFFMINREYYQALKLALREYYGDRDAFGIGGDFASDPARYGWNVRILKTGSIVIG